MNKASMVNEICSTININYLSSMHKMSYEEVKELYDGLVKMGTILQEIKEDIILLQKLKGG